MPILTPSCPLTFNTTANLKAFGDMIGNSFRQMGWVKSDVVGQTTFSVLPPAIDDLSQWEIWGMGDSFQQTNPCWLKIFYSKSHPEPTYPKIFVQVGTGVNPDGSLQNPSPVMSVFGYTTSSAVTTSVTHLVFGDSGNIFFILRESNTSHRTIWSCGRTKSLPGWVSTGDIWFYHRGLDYNLRDQPWGSCLMLDSNGWRDYETLPNPYVRDANTLKFGSDLGFLPICNRSYTKAVPIFFSEVTPMPQARTAIDLRLPQGDTPYMWMGNSVSSGDVMNLYYEGKTWGTALPWNWT